LLKFSSSILSLQSFLGFRSGSGVISPTDAHSAAAVLIERGDAIQCKVFGLDARFKFERPLAQRVKAGAKVEASLRFVSPNGTTRNGIPVRLPSDPSDIRLSASLYAHLELFK